jgi:hypothetical protein
MIDERALFEKILAGDANARAELFANYRGPMLKVWRRRKKGLCTDDLDDDFIHWVLIEWISRPKDSFRNLEKFLRTGASRNNISFLAWWSAIARHRFSDFYREKIRSRFEQELLADNYRVIDLWEEPASELPLADHDTAVALGECFDQLLGKEPHQALHKLGFELKDGTLSQRRGRVAQDMLTKAASIGSRLSSRGFTAEEVRRALPAFLQTLAGERG